MKFEMIILVLAISMAASFYAGTQTADTTDTGFQIQKELSQIDQLGRTLLITEYQSSLNDRQMIEIANPEKGVLTCVRMESWRNDPEVKGIYDCTLDQNRTHPLLRE